MGEPQQADSVNAGAWDLRAHRSLRLQARGDADIHSEVGGGFDVVRLAHGEPEDGLEDLCARAAKSCFTRGVAGEWHVNPHPVSGSIANLAVLTGLVEPGERIASFASRSVGHFSLGGASSLADRLYAVSSPELTRDADLLDFSRLWREQWPSPAGRPSLIAFGPSAYPRRVDWASLRVLADSFSPPALLLADVSHLAGPIAAGLLESPCACADIVTLTTYKSLGGPPGAIILSRSRELHERIGRALIPGLQDRAYHSSLEELASGLARVYDPLFRDVQERAVRLAADMADALNQGGLLLAFGGTDTHLVVVDLAPLGILASEATALLAAHRIIADPVVLPGDATDRPQGLRFGTVVVAQQGREEEQVRLLGKRIAGLLLAADGRQLVDITPGVVEPVANKRLKGQRLTSALDDAGHPDDFMFRQFRRHSRVLRTPARHDYFMLSGGANLFPVSAVWKELLQLEIDYDLAYGWYTAQEGFPSLQRAVSMWENYLASRGNFPVEKPLGSHVAMTLGATQAAAAVFDYWADSGHTRVLLVGLNYALFERLARQHQFEIRELVGENAEGGTLPPAEQVASAIRKYGPALVVLVTPNNPSGEQYAASGVVQILHAAVGSGSVVLSDQVGQMPIAQNGWLNLGEIIVQEGAQDSVVMINSFSKSDGVPGFRLGYLLGPERMAQHAGSYQFASTMNPPTVPLLPPFFSLLYRCVHVGERLAWVTPDDPTRILSFARHMIEVTTAIAPPSLLEEVHRRLSGERFASDYRRYVSDQERVGSAIRRNHTYVLERLAKYVTRTTALHGGFNFLVELEPFDGLDEDEVCQRLFKRTAVAILTESCFRITARKRQNFWVRVSLAAPPERFERAVDRLALFLEEA